MGLDTKHVGKCLGSSHIYIYIYYVTSISPPKHMACKNEP